MSALLFSNLGVVCPSCDFLNVVGAATCMACNAAIADGAAAKPSVPKTATPPPAEAVPPGLKRNPTPAPIPKVQTPAPQPKTATPVPAPKPAPAPVVPVATPVPQAAPAGPKFGLTVLAGPARGQRFRLGANGAALGRSKGVILFPDDPFISPLHATFLIKDNKLIVRDENSTSGVFALVNGQESLASNTYFSAGIRLMRYIGPLDAPPPIQVGKLTVYGAPVPAHTTLYALEEVLLGGRPGRVVVSSGPSLTVGQSKCDFSFPDDEALAPRHAEITLGPGMAQLRDHSGGLGTYVRVVGERALKAGDKLRVGQQTLQVEAL